MIDFELRWKVGFFTTSEVDNYSIAELRQGKRILQYRTRDKVSGHSHAPHGTSIPTWSEWQDVPEEIM